MSHSYKPIILCILDGWGISSKQEHNAIKQAKTPSLDYLLDHFPSTQLSTSGMDVGLPSGQMGNSEVGHMTIGSGRVNFQDLVRINLAIENGDLARDTKLQNLIEFHQNNNKAVHLLGLCSDGGVHSHINHLLYIAKLLAQKNITVNLHLFLDGRDVAPRSAARYLTQVDALRAQCPSIHIATISGRFYAMDRDNRWERTELCLNAIVKAQGQVFDNWPDYIKQQYSQNISDEFIIPASFKAYEGISPGDSLFFLNFRSDRVRQIAQKLVDLDSDFTYKIGMTNYSKELSQSLTPLFPEHMIHNGLGEIVSAHHKKQLRLAETEKYAHVTFFLNSGREEPYPGEDRILVPSPQVKTYDLQPEMSAFKLTDELIKAIESKKYDLIVINYANADMVGHSGLMSPAIKAAEAIDQCIERIYQAIKLTDGALLITADHGNIECMFDEGHNMPHTSHTLNPVPFIIVANDLENRNIKLSLGNLSDIAPTILKLMNIKQPNEMTGRNIYVD